MPVGADDEATVTAALGSMARSTGAPNLTTEALAGHLPGDPVPVRDEVAFSSALRWSALQTDGATLGAGGTGGAGARPARAGPRRPQVRARTAEGLRVLLFARATDPGVPLRGPDGAPSLPALEPLAVVALADELRPDVPETLARFRQEGIGLKVLSGDDPDTVAALASRAGPRATSPVHAGQPARALGRGAGPRRRPRRRLRPGRARAEGADRPVAAPAGPLRGHGRRRRERRPRPQGRPGRRGHAQRQRRHPRRRRHRAHRRLAGRAGPGPPAGAAHHRRHLRVGAGVPRARRHPGPGDRRRHDAGAGLPVLPRPGRADAVHRRRPDAVPDRLGPAAPPDPHLLATIGRFVLPAAVLTAGGGVAVYAALYTRVAAALHRRERARLRRHRVRAVHRPDLRRGRRLRRRGSDDRRPDRAVHVRVAGLGAAHPLPRPAHPAARRLDPRRPATGGPRSWWPRCSPS